MRASPEFLSAIDEWRRQQPDLPPRAEAIRRIVEQALSPSETIGALIAQIFREQPDQIGRMGIDLDEFPNLKTPELVDLLFTEGSGKRARSSEVDVRRPAARLKECFAGVEGQTAARIRALLEPMIR